MLRAAYFAQELLSTFETAIGEVALIPATGGLFTVELAYVPAPNDDSVDDKNILLDPEVRKVLLWDRKAEGGFPETKVLKQRVRDHIQPGRDLGHSDKHGKKKVKEAGSYIKGEDAVTSETALVRTNADGTPCEDCS